MNAPLRFRLRREWTLLVAALAVLTAVLAWERWTEWRSLGDNERARLASAAATIELGLTVQLGSVRAALLGVAAELAAHDGELPVALQGKMTLLADVMPSAHTLLLLDLDGRVRAGNRPSLLGSSFAGFSLVHEAQQQPRRGVMHLSKPFASELGTVSVSLTLPALADDGRLLGLVTAVLDPAYLQTLLDDELYAPGMWALLAHVDGQPLLRVPAQALAEPGTLAEPGVPFRRHVDSGARESLFDGVAGPPGERRLMALRTLDAEALRMSAPLVLTVARPAADVVRGWWQQTAVGATLWLALVTGGSVALRRLQRRDAEAAAQEAQHEAERAAERAEATERLELALAGADLGLWDLDLRSGECQVNDRWFAMLGEAPGSVGTDAEAWSARIHEADRLRVRELSEAHLAGRTAYYEARYRLRHADGRWLWLLDRGRVVSRDAEGRALRMVGTHQDVTEPTLIEEALRRNEESLAITLHSIGDAVIATDTAGCITRINAAAEALTGWPAAEAEGRPLSAVFRVLHSASRQPADDPVARVLAEGRKVELANEALLVARDGTERPIADSAAPIRSGEGTIVGVVLVFSDVSDRYRMLQVLRDRERQLSAIAEALPGPVARVGLDGVYRFANRVYERWFWRGAGSIVGRTETEVLGPRRAEWARPWIARAQAGETLHLESPTRTQLGRLHVLVTLVPDLDDDGRPCGHFELITDITERKRAEDALRHSERSSRGLLEALRAGVVTHGPDTRVRSANPAACRLLGLSMEQFLGRAAVDPRWHFVEADGSPMPLARYPVNQVLAARQPIDDFVGGVVRPDAGAITWLLVNAIPVHDAAGGIAEVVVTFVDVTDRHNAEAALRASQAELLAAQRDLAATLEAVPDLLFELEADGRFLEQHTPRRELLLLPPEQFVGRRFDEVMPPEAVPAIRAALEEALERGWSIGQQYSLQMPDGRRAWFELSVSRKAMPDGAPPRLLALARDISDRMEAESQRRELEQRLADAQKLESIGTLASGIAHDFNNLLPAILGHAALASEQLPPDHPARAGLEQIRRASLRARGLVQQILTYTRSAPQRREVLALAPLVQEAVALLRAALPAGARLVTQLPEERLCVDGDATQLHQVLVNLCTNAAQALVQGQGRIEVGLEPLADREAPDAALPAWAPGLPPSLPASRAGWLHLWVRDDGQGMDDATQRRIFEPFFTTKPVGQGTGLGLAVVHGIVKSHGGSITVDSAPGQGSTFHLWLPRVAEPAGPGLAAPGTLPPAQGQGERVLYVDDDEVVSVMVEQLLRRLGYRVRAFGQAQAALEALQQAPGEVDIVVTDYNMPGLSGLDVARAVAALRPGLPVIISSGYIDAALEQSARDAGVRALVSKARTLEELGPLLQRVLAGRA